MSRRSIAMAIIVVTLTSVTFDARATGDARSVTYQQNVRHSGRIHDRGLNPPFKIAWMTMGGFRPTVDIAVSHPDPQRQMTACRSDSARGAVCVNGGADRVSPWPQGRTASQRLPIDRGCESTRGVVNGYGVGA
jgi:hypothetical protein